MVMVWRLVGRRWKSASASAQGIYSGSKPSPDVHAPFSSNWGSKQYLGTSPLR
jgi:hypothetical protein